MFNQLFIAMIEAGEPSGTLDQVLDRVAMQIEKETQIKRRVKGAMVYPIVVLTFATLVLIFMLLFIVPVFAERLRRSRRRAPGSDEGRGRRLELPAGLLVHHLPGLVRGRLSCSGV